MARILVVNDEADLVELCALVLLDAGYEVETLTDGPKVVATALRIRPDLVVLDWILKDCTGDIVLRELRLEPGTARTPVLMVSALADGEAQAKLYGLEGYLGKPFTAEALVTAVRRVLDGRAS